MIFQSLRLFAILGALFAAPGILTAGVNTWTGARPMGVPDWEAGGILAAHPGNPYVVYGAFGTTLYRSADGGRTWRGLRTFASLYALLVHPAAPSDVYVAGSEFVGDTWNSGVFKSTDAGETWTYSLREVSASVLAGSPTDPSTVFAGSGAWIYRTTDAGETWADSDSVSGWLASLIIHPREPNIAFAAAEGFDYWGLTQGSVSRTNDGGESWIGATPRDIESVSAVAVDAISPSTVYIGTGPYLFSTSTTLSDVMRSEDGGATWVSTGEGLRGKGIEVLAADPQVSGMVYAGTSAGLYRSGSGGGRWSAFGRQLAATVFSLSILDGGRRLYASTTSGAYELEIARGPLDVAVSAAEESRILVWDGERLSVGSLDSSGLWTNGSPGEASGHWTAVALAESGGRAYVLWQAHDGRSALEIVGSAGRQSVQVFPSRPDWIASDISVRADGQTHLLWTGSDGRMFIAKVRSSGAVADGPVYGPAPGWSAIAMADGAGSDTWVLWRGTDGRFAVSSHRDGAMVASYKFAAEPDWAAEDLAIGADGRLRILRTAPGGVASVSTIDDAGRLAATHVHRLPGLTPRRIAAGGDGLTRLLLSGEGGEGELLLLEGDNTLSSRHTVPSESFVREP